MSGSRCKALKAEFRRDYGRSVETRGHQKRDPVKRNGRVLKWLYWFTMQTPSEWRRLKKDYVRGK